MSRDAGDGLTYFWIFAILGCGFWYFVTDADWAEKIRAGFKYHMDSSKISVVGLRPHDCEFLTAPLGSKQCHYDREYRAEWMVLSNGNPPVPISYGTLQSEPPVKCSHEELDFGHKCYVVDDLAPGEKGTNTWTARRLEIHWKRVVD